MSIKKFLLAIILSFYSLSLVAVCACDISSYQLLENIDDATLKTEEKVIDISEPSEGSGAIYYYNSSNKLIKVKVGMYGSIGNIEIVYYPLGDERYIVDYKENKYSQPLDAETIENNNFDITQTSSKSFCLQNKQITELTSKLIEDDEKKLVLDMLQQLSITPK